LDPGFARVARSVPVPERLAVQFASLDESATDCSLSLSDDSDDVVGLLLDWNAGFVEPSWQLSHLAGQANCCSVSRKSHGSVAVCLVC